MKTEWNGDAAYCSFYCAFGGLNSGTGAKNKFEIKLEPAAAKIYFDRGEAGNALVLRKDETRGAWMLVQETQTAEIRGLTGAGGGIENEL